jgi:hypothetical protein
VLFQKYSLAMRGSTKLRSQAEAKVTFVSWASYTSGVMLSLFVASLYERNMRAYVCHVGGEELDGFC